MTKRILVFILVLLFLFAPYLVYGQNLDPPSDYDSLLEKYQDAISIAQEYKRLYEEERADSKRWEELYVNAETDNERLLQSNKRLQDLVDVQSEIIDELLNRKDLRLMTGLNIVPGSLKNSGIIIGGTIGF